MKIAGFFKGDTRTRRMGRDIIGSILLKGISMLLSLLIVPMTINYVNPTQYGIWLTLSSLISWIVFFDAGLTLGFRNKFGDAIAKGKHSLGRVYVSNAFASLGVICFLIVIAVIVGGKWIDWTAVLNIPSSYKEELGKVFILMVLFFSLQLVMQVTTAMLAADQKVMYTGLINVIGQAVGLLVLWLLLRKSHYGSILSLVWVVSGVPVGVLLLFSIMLFFEKYHEYTPTIHYVRFRYIKDILGMGYKFFIITTSMLFIFQIMNVIISRELGPESVTEYNIAYKYYNIAYMILVLVLNPVWSAFTNAYSHQDLSWMRSIKNKLEKISLLIPLIVLLMCGVSGVFYKIWIGDSVTVSLGVNISMAIYIILLSMANVYMYMVNGIGKVKLQLIIYILFALFSYPVMGYLCAGYGIPGMLLLPCIVYLVQGLLLRIQINKLVRGEAHGIWNS